MLPQPPPVIDSSVGTAPDEDRYTLQAVRDAFVKADNAGDVEAMARLLTDDVVVLHPDCGVIAGKEAVPTFMGTALADIRVELDKHPTYAAIELKIGGDLACERGTLLQQLTPKAGGLAMREEGTYLWIDERRDGGW